MTDYTIEVYDTGPDLSSREFLYDFVVGNVQAVVASRWEDTSDPNYSPPREKDEFTKVPVWSPPDYVHDVEGPYEGSPEGTSDVGEFRWDVARRMGTIGDRHRVFDILDSSGDLVVDGNIPKVEHYVKIAGDEVTEGLYFLYFEDVVGSLPNEHTTHQEEPPYPTPWGHWEDWGYAF